MEQALIDALKQFGPAAIVIGAPCFFVIRALWTDNKALTREVRDLATKSIEAHIEGRHVIERLVEKLTPRGSA